MVKFLSTLIFLGSSMVERIPVKDKVLGSSPSRGAEICYYNQPYCQNLASSHLVLFYKFMKKQELQKLHELEYAQFFIDWFNGKYGLDYKVLPNKEEYSDTDIFADSDTQEQLLLQNVTSGGEMLELAHVSAGQIQRGEQINAMQVRPLEWISKSIDDKEKKYGNLAQSLMLLVEGFLPVPSPEEISGLSAKYKDSKFKAIFYVSPPVLSSTREEYEEKGYVYPIKGFRVS